MATIPQVIHQIKFALSELGSQNAHHEFEHLCRQWAKKRICANILPSTGPVSAGGDQGSDFETFRSHVAATFGVESAVSIVSKKKIVFACTTQSSDVPGKIDSDVTKIVAQNIGVNEVHYFTTQNVVVAKRHELQKAAHGRGVHLEIYDLTGISEALADADMFWIATEHLDIPQDIYPKQGRTGTDWYEKLKTRYVVKQGVLALNFAEFFELKRCVRASTFDETKRPDLRMWLALLSQYARGGGGQRLKNFASYEMFVASLRGLEEVAPHETSVIELFSQLSELSDPGDLENLQVLLSYLLGAHVRGLTATISRDQLSGWRKELVARINHLRSSTGSPSRKLALLELLGNLEVFSDDLQPEPSLTRALDTWSKMLPYMEEGRLFPIERFSDQLTSYIGMFGGNARLDEFAAMVDEFVSRRAGKSAAAEKCRDRALAYYKNGEILKAIDLLHDAKIKWYQRETIKGSILSIILISQWYSQVGLQYAAKYYALAALRVAWTDPDSSLKKYLPEIGSALCSLEFGAGNWLTFVDRVSLFLRIYQQYNPDPSQNLFLDKTSSAIGAQLSVLVAISEKINPMAMPRILENVSKFGLDETLSETFDSARKVWASRNLVDIKKTCEEKINDRPFADCGGERRINFHALGVRFSTIFPNSFEANSLAEAFVAMLQIFLADFGFIDLKLLPGAAVIRFEVVDGETLAVDHEASNEDYRWVVKWPRENGSDRSVQELAAVFQILQGLSLEEDKVLWTVFEERLKKGVVSKIFVVDSYPSLLANLSAPDDYDQPGRCVIGPAFEGEDFNGAESELLGWVQTLDRNYNAVAAVKAIERRYNGVLPTIQITLPRLCRVPTFIDTINEIRKEGWLDWQVLAAIGATALSYRISKDLGKRVHEPGLLQQEMGKRMKRAETADDAEVPASIFSKEALEIGMKTNMLATLKGLGFQYPTQTPNFEGVRRYLQARWRYFEDDVPHPDPFVATQQA